MPAVCPWKGSTGDGGSEQSRSWSAESEPVLKRNDTSATALPSIASMTFLSYPRQENECNYAEEHDYERCRRVTRRPLWAARTLHLPVPRPGLEPLLGS